MTLGYLIEFALRDLTAPTARRATVVVVSAVAFAVAFGLVGFGFVYGVERAEYALLLRDPLALCLWAGDNTINGGHIVAADVEGVKKAVAEKLGPAGGLRGVYPIRLVQFSFKRANGNDTPITGRTMQVGAEPDPLPQSRPVHAGGQWFSGAGEHGIVVAPDFFQRLDFTKGEPPRAIKLVPGYPREAIDINVIGVLQKPLPERSYGFIVSESFAREMAAPPDDNPLTALATSGPIPDDWAKAEKCPEVRRVIAEVFPKKDYVVHYPLAGDCYRLVVKTQMPKPSDEEPTPRRQHRKREWEALFERIARETSHCKPAAESDFPKALVQSETDGVPGIQNGSAEASGYDLLAIYVTDVNALKSAADAAEKYVLPKNNRPLAIERGVVEQVKRIGQQSSQYQRAMIVVAGSMAVLVMVMVWFVFQIRAEQQIAEIGMLKAMGMDRLGLLAAIQGLMVGLVATALGIVVGWLAIGIVAALFYAEPLGSTAAAYRESWLIALIAAVANVGCIACAWEASRRARRLSPAEAIRTAG